MTASSPIHVFPDFLTSVLHTTVFASNWVLFHIDFAHWWKTNEAHLKFTTPGLTARVATDSACRAFIRQILFYFIQVQRYDFYDVRELP